MFLWWIFVELKWCISFSGISCHNAWKSKPPTISPFSPFSCIYICFTLFLGGFVWSGPVSRLACNNYILSFLCAVYQDLLYFPSFFTMWICSTNTINLVPTITTEFDLVALHWHVHLFWEAGFRLFLSQFQSSCSIPSSNSFQCSNCYIPMTMSNLM